MNKKPNLIVDVDGVLLDPITGFMKWFFVNFPDVDLFRVLKNNKNIIDSCINAFWNSENFTKIPARKNAKPAINYLKTYYNIDVVSNCGNDNRIKECRIQNLENIFGKDAFRNIYLLPFRQPKKEVYSLYKGNAFVIDDELPNLLDAVDCNLEYVWMSYFPVLKSMFYNDYDRSLEYLFKKQNWTETIKFLKEKQH